MVITPTARKQNRASLKIMNRVTSACHLKYEGCTSQICKFHAFLTTKIACYSRLYIPGKAAQTDIIVGVIHCNIVRPLSHLCHRRLFVRRGQGELAGESRRLDDCCHVPTDYHWFAFL